MENSRIKNKKKYKRRRLFWFILFPLLLVIGSGVGYGGYLFAKANGALKSAHQSLSRGDKSELRDYKVKPLTHNISILFVGVDESEKRKESYGEAVRSDALLVATLNKDTKDVNLVSIPRDTYTYLPIRDKYDKINHAHAFGGLDATIDAVEHLFEIPIDYYVELNFEGFLGIIDELGGIEIDVPITFTEQNSEDKAGAIHLEEGLQTLNAEETLALARTRKIDSDMERGKRQMLIMEAILKKATSVGSVTKLDNVIDTLGDNMRTNLTFSDIMSLFSYATAEKGIQLNKLQVEGEDATIRGIYYYRPIEESLEELKSTLQQHLDYKASKVEVPE